MRISDWSSDVCSSDLPATARLPSGNSPLASWSRQRGRDSGAGARYGGGLMRHVAIVGSGPAGYYTAEALQKADDIAVDVIDRLPVPYGLIRTGVAPDHQSIKAVSHRYEGVALTDTVRFAIRRASCRESMCQYV